MTDERLIEEAANPDRRRAGSDAPDHRAGSYSRRPDDLPYADVADRLAVAGFGFRRSEVPEPTCEHGTSLTELCEHVERLVNAAPQDEPSDAQVEQYLLDHGHYVPDELRASLRAARALIRCDYCGDALPSVRDRADVPTTPDLQRMGFAADKVVCPECVERVRAAGGVR